MQNFSDLSKFNNSWYDSGGTRIKIALWYFTNILFLMNPLNPISCIKVYLLRLFGAKIGKNVVIKPSVNIKYPWRLFVGDNTWIGEKTWIDNLSNVYIGNNVCISQGAMLLTGNHNYKKVTFDLVIGEIRIEDGVWIGAHSVVCSGVTCFSHAILTVNSVATKNLEAYSIYQGNPALKTRNRIFNNEG
jgi:putative colanic acid biosynthesis acetyltransferase WcaF